MKALTVKGTSIKINELSPFAVVQLDESGEYLDVLGAVAFARHPNHAINICMQRYKDFRDERDAGGLFVALPFHAPEVTQLIAQQAEGMSPDQLLYAYAQEDAAYRLKKMRARDRETLRAERKRLQAETGRVKKVKDVTKGPGLYEKIPEDLQAEAAPAAKPGAGIDPFKVRRSRKPDASPTAIEVERAPAKPRLRVKADGSVETVETAAPAPKQSRLKNPLAGLSRAIAKRVRSA